MHISQNGTAITRNCHWTPLSAFRKAKKSVECKCVGNKLKQLDPQINIPKCACTEAGTQACTCKCVTNTVKKIKCHKNELKSNPCACAQTQLRNYGDQTQSDCNKSLYVERGTSGDCKCSKIKPLGRNICTSRIPDCNVAQKCACPAACQKDGIKRSLETFKSIFRQVIKPREVWCLTNNLKIILSKKNAPKPPCTCEAKTQSPSYQTAGRESFCRGTGTSEIPNYVKCRREEVRHDFFYHSCKPAMTDRCTGCTKYNIKCPNIGPYCIKKHTQSSTNCKLNNFNKEKGGFTILCNMMLQPSNTFPGSKKCYKNRGTFCRVDENEGSVLKKLCELLVEKRTKPVVIGAEAMTQSRSCGGRHYRAGREIFCKNRGTSGAPKLVQQRPEQEEYEEIIEEIPYFKDEQPGINNKTVGIGTNCRFKFGLYKDRHAYGEPKLHCGLKRVIDQWNEIPLRQRGTKMDTSLKCDANIHCYNTNAATQSRKCSGSHLRAGRETFYRNAQTICVPRNNNNNFEEFYSTFNPHFAPCPPPPDRKAIRWGSDCSFSFEISKDSPAACPLTSKPCGDRMDVTQNKTGFYSKFIRQFVSPLDNGRQIGRSDACTCTDICQERNNEPECPSKLCKRRPLHIGSKINYHLNISKRIYPPKSECTLVQEPCIQSIRPQPIETRCDAVTPACVLVPDTKKKDKDTGRVTKSKQKVVSELESELKSKPEKVMAMKAIFDNFKTAKERFLERSSGIKNNFSRLITGEPSETEQCETEQNITEQYETEQNEIQPTPEQSLRSSSILKKTNVACPAECNRKCEQVEKPGQPLRLKSHCSFDYNLKIKNPKHEKGPYEKLRLEDFDGSERKMNLFRLIIGRLRKPVKRKPVKRKPSAYVTYDPIESRETKQDNNSLCAELKELILANIKQEKQLDDSYEEAKKFFSNILLKNQRKKESGNDSCITSKFKELLKKTCKRSRSSCLRQMLARRGDPIRRRRRRCRSYSRRSNSNSYSDAIESMDLDTLASSILTPSRRSRTSDDDYPPCKITSDCCFKCDYSKLDESDN